MSHRNARLTPTGRRAMIERIVAATPLTDSQLEAG